MVPVHMVGCAGNGGSGTGKIAAPVNEQQLEMQAEWDEGISDDDSQWQQLE